MCGIFSIISYDEKIDISYELISGLKLLEYRGYDSAGIALLKKEQNSNISNDIIQMHSMKSVGTIDQLESAYHSMPINGYAGIAHTRWATHGAVTIKNTHPIIVEEIAVVHNGVVENYFELRQELHQNYGYIAITDTDTEVIAALIHYYFLQFDDLQIAVRRACKKLVGKLAFIAISNKNPKEMICASFGRSLVIGHGKNRNYIASDVVAFPNDVNTITYLENGDIATVSGNTFTILNLNGEIQIRPTERHSYFEYKTVYESHKTFMHKEICEQKDILQVITGKIRFDIEQNTNTSEILNAFKNINIQNFESIHIIACGAAYYAGYVGKYLIERECKIFTSIDIASEFCTRSPVLNSKTLYVFVSQSGETADTISAMEYVQKFGMTTLAIVNRMQSPLAKKCDYTIPICAGIEQSVAATKTFTAQILIFVLLTQYSINKLYEFVKSIDVETFHITQFLEDSVIKGANEISSANRILYIGKDILYPICLEGALKIKEIGYIAAEGIAAGEIKHGPLALVDEHTPVVILAPYSKNELFTKIVSNIQEISARNGKIILITCKKGHELLYHIGISNVIVMPTVHDLLTPILYAIPLQLLAYHYSSNMGYNIDKPRNLAKSVTVE